MDIHDQSKNRYEQKRLKILGKDEINEIYGRPRFTLEERRHYFSLSSPEKELLKILRSVNSQAYFVLQLGYFKAKRLFFTFEFNDIIDDFQYILNEHFNRTNMGNITTIFRLTRLKHQNMILELFNYHTCGVNEKNQLEIKARKAVLVCGKPIYIFREIMHYLYEKQIMAPGYSFLQEIVDKTLIYEQNRLVTIMKTNLEQSNIKDLNLLLEDSEGLYIITQIKHEPKVLVLVKSNLKYSEGNKYSRYTFLLKIYYQS